MASICVFNAHNYQMKTYKYKYTHIHTSSLPLNLGSSLFAASMLDFNIAASRVASPPDLLFTWCSWGQTNFAQVCPMVMCSCSLQHHAWQVTQLIMHALHEMWSREKNDLSATCHGYAFIPYIITSDQSQAWFFTWCCWDFFCFNCPLSLYLSLSHSLIYTTHGCTRAHKKSSWCIRCRIPHTRTSTHTHMLTALLIVCTAKVTASLTSRVDCILTYLHHTVLRATHKYSTRDVRTISRSFTELLNVCTSEEAASLISRLDFIKDIFMMRSAASREASVWPLFACFWPLVDFDEVDADEDAVTPALVARKDCSALLYIWCFALLTLASVFVCMCLYKYVWSRLCLPSTYRATFKSEPVVGYFLHTYMQIQTYQADS